MFKRKKKTVKKKEAKKPVAKKSVKVPEPIEYVKEQYVGKAADGRTALMSRMVKKVK